MSGDYAFVADGSSGLRIVNITTPSSPSPEAGYNMPGNAQAVAVAGEALDLKPEIGERLRDLIHGGGGVEEIRPQTCARGVRVDRLGPGQPRRDHHRRRGRLSGRDGHGGECRIIPRGCRR